MGGEGVNMYAIMKRAFFWTVFLTVSQNRPHTSL